MLVVVVPPYVDDTTKCKITTTVDITHHSSDYKFASVSMPLDSTRSYLISGTLPQSLT